MSNYFLKNTRFLEILYLLKESFILNNNIVFKSNIKNILSFIVQFSLKYGIAHEIVIFFLSMYYIGQVKYLVLDQTQ